MDMHNEIIRQLMHNKRYEAVTEFAKINSADRKETIIVTEYAGDCARLMKRDNDIYILCPKEIDIVQEAGIADSIANGTIFDDASLLEDQADYMQRTILPMNAIANKHGIEPKKVKVMITGVMGRLNDGGNIEISVNDMENGKNFLHDLTSGTGIPHVNKMCDHYLGIKNADDRMEGHCSLPLPIRKDISALTKEIDSIVDIEPDDEVTDDDFVPFNYKYDKHVNDIEPIEEAKSEDIEDTAEDTEEKAEKIEDESSDDEKDEEKDSDTENDEDAKEEESESEEDEKEESEDEDDESEKEDDEEGSDDEITDDGEVESKKDKKSKKKDKKEEDDDEDPEDDTEEDKAEDDENEDEEEFDESYIGEAFFKRPKKLKPIPRDIVSYITVEMNAIRDSNDQAMIAGYCSAKLELVDFYLNCIDTQDDRYVVPHTKQYLTQMQSELNNLLKRILQVKPVNKYDRIWGGIL